MTLLSNSLKAGALGLPPKISINSYVSLNAALSNFISLPGVQSKMNPKSIWIRWPLSSIRILPLCRSLICKINETTAYAAKLFIKLYLANLNSEVDSLPYFFKKYSCRLISKALPSWSRLWLLGTTSIIPPRYFSTPVLLLMHL